MNKKLKYLIVNLSDLEKMNSDEALFLAYLKQVSRVMPKKGEYFELDMGLAGRTLSLSRKQVMRLRDRLIDLDQLAYIPGRNQNSKPRWKLL